MFPTKVVQVWSNETLKATTPGQVVAIPIGGVAHYNGIGCIDWAPLLSASSQANAGQAWQYILCSYLIATEGDVSKDNSLLPPFMDKGLTNGCSNPEWMGPDYNMTEAEFEAKHNITDQGLDHVTRLLITQGTLDRTLAIGSPILSWSSDFNHSKLITVTDMAHGENVFPESRYPGGSRPQIDEVRLRWLVDSPASPIRQ